MTTSDVDFEQLTKRIQSLTPELFNNILDFVLTIDETGVRIDNKYKPPAQLQIDRASRQSLAKQYYSKNTFTISFFTYDWARKWLSCLPHPHLLLISNIRLDHGTLLSRRNHTRRLEDAKYRLAGFIMLANRQFQKNDMNVKGSSAWIWALEQKLRINVMATNSDGELVEEWWSRSELDFVFR